VIGLKTYNVEIKGVTPLLFNRFIESTIASQVKKRVGATKEINVEDKLYKTTDGKIYTPATHIRGMLINAGKYFKIQGKGKATYSKIIGATVTIQPEAIVHENQKWEIFSISGVNPSTRGRTMIHRPMMKEWKLSFQLIFNPEEIPEDVMKNILDYGGNYVGIGDWRPEKKGQFGKFIVTKFEELKE